MLPLDVLVIRFYSCFPLQMHGKLKRFQFKKNEWVKQLFAEKVKDKRQKTKDKKRGGGVRGLSD